ncbi:hypothetical protein BGZ93_011183 [Podila epicladia]|nr:hypothetical protein BGZ92_001649 [Podila epicladia]KAG0087050.1 hypothetical protein BGZ93_011183 [Podila epicladia]
MSANAPNTLPDPDQTQPTPPLELPEVLYNLVQFLDRKSLVQAALVCRSWSRLFSPMLYQDIRVKDWEYPGFINKFCEHLPEVVKLEWKKSRQEAKRRYRMTLNSLPSPHDLLDDPDDQAAVDPFLPSMDNMCLTDLASILAPEKTRRLRLLVIQGETSLRQFLITILPKIPTLTCLKIEDSFSWQKIAIHEILNTCQSLQSLDCDSSVSLQFNECQSLPYPTNKDGTYSAEIAAALVKSPLPSRSTSASLHPELPTQALRVLRLHKTSLSDQELLTFVRECPQLEEIYLHQESALAGGLPVSTTSATHQWNWSTEFAAGLSHACPKLVKLHLSPGCFQSLPEDIIQTVLTAFPKLHSLGTPYSKFGDETMQMIIDTRTGGAGLDHGLSKEGFAYLTSLDITNLKGHRLSSAMLQRFLEACATLVHFWADDILHVQDMLVDPLRLGAKQDSDPSDPFVLRPWACRRLETLVIGFQAPSGSSPNVDRAIYQQLGQLTQLRRLEILSSRPAFSLSIGLDLLQGLKVLQYYRIAKRVSRSSFFGKDETHPQMEELEWVARTWTCLQELILPMEIQIARTIASQLRALGRTDIVVVSKV